MKYRRLGRTDMRVSVVGIGAWQFGGEWGHDFTQAEADAVFGRAAERGINFIDTAECYGDHLSEEMVGNFTNGQRNKWIIATKFGHKYTDRFQREELWSASDVQKQLEDSLRSLKTDYVDLYQFHSGADAAFDNQELWTMLAKQIEAGKVRHLGISIGSGAENIYQTDKATEVGASVIQVVYNRLERGPESRVLPSCERQDLGVLARVPLASGYLSGKYKPGATFDETDVRSRHKKAAVDEKLRQVEEIKANEVPEGVNMATWALAWCLKHPAVTAVIPGCKNPAQVDSNADAADLDMVSNEHPQAI